jgi:putative ABC transport system permease protein
MPLRWFENLRELFTREREDADLERELRSHLEAEIDDQLEKGLRPDQARDAARRALGNLPIIQENTRAAWTLGRTVSAVRSLFAGVHQDVRYGLRSLRKQPAFTAAAVLALALGIGASTTIFSVIQNVLLDPYPMYANVDRIVGLRVHDDASARPGGRQFFQVPEFLDYQVQATSFEEVIAGTGEDTLYTSKEGTEQFSGGLASGNTFSFMGVSAVVGRTISADDAKPDAAPVFVMSYKLWANRFGQDERLIGRSFTLNGVPTTLIGVMPPRVSKLGAELWRPVRLDRADPTQTARFFRFQARLRPGVTIEDARAEVNVIARRLAKVYPQLYPAKFTVQVEGLIDSIVGPFRTTLYTMAAAVGLLLLIACANVANMLLSRAAGREREMALRASLGAGRGRLVQQLLVESLLLAIVGMAIGCAFSALGISLLVAAIPEGLIPRESLIRLDTTALTFSLVVAVLTAALFGLAPALQTVKRDLLNPLRGSGKGTASGFRGTKLSSGLVIAEIALSIVLLNSAGLLMRSFLKLQATELGLNPANLLFVRIPVGSGHQKTAASQQQFLSQVLNRVRAVPGVVSASATTGFPPFGGFAIGFDIPGIGHQDRWRADLELCSDGYFRTLGMRLLQGRDFTADDLNANRKVAVVNHALVERHLKGVAPVGRTIALKLRNDDGQTEDRTFEIVGVVSDAKNDGVTDPPGPEIFLPSSAAPTMSRGLVMRTAGPPMLMVPSVKREIWSVDRGVAISDAEAVTEYLKRFTYAEPRLGVFVFGAFAAIGMVLVVIGVYSLIAYTVARQMREIGIRMAIGASRSDVLRMTVGLGIRWMGIGVLVGLLASLAVTRVLASQLFDVSPTDPLTLACVIAVVAISGFSASYFPALRATRVDPMVMLRYE